MIRVFCLAIAPFGKQPLKEVAELFAVSPSRISRIQQLMETIQLPRLQRKAMKLCNIKK